MLKVKPIINKYECCLPKYTDTEINFSNLSGYPVNWNKTDMLLASTKESIKIYKNDINLVFAFA